MKKLIYHESTKAGKHGDSLGFFRAFVIDLLGHLPFEVRLFLTVKSGKTNRLTPAAGCRHRLLP